MKTFNKQNMLKFANKIYKEKGNDIYYRPMCNGHLAKSNGHIVGCIIAELYEEFEGKDVGRPLTEEEITKGKNHHWGLSVNDRILQYINLYDKSVKIVSADIDAKMAYFINENMIIRKLLKRAKMSRPKPIIEEERNYTLSNIGDIPLKEKWKRIFEYRLHEVININDSVPDNYIDRAKRTSDFLKFIAKRYLI